MQDWISLAGALGAAGINSWGATRSDVAAVLRCVDETRDLRLGTVGRGFDEISTPLPVENILDLVFSERSEKDRAAAMMTYFIDVRAQ